MRFAVCFIILFLGLQSLAQNKSYKIVDLNIRYNNPNDIPNDWNSRKMGTLQWLKKQKADFYFFQEVLSEQLTDLQSGLQLFESYGIGREDGKTKGEFSPIFYNSEKFQFISGETLWLSETPQHPSKGWDAACERIITHLILCDKNSHDTLDLVNTHWDHIGREAQMHSAEQMTQLIRSIPQHHRLICGGDFNTDIHSTPIQFLITSNELAPSGDLSIWETNSYHGFGKVDSGKCIDFIFYNHYQFESDHTFKTRFFREHRFSQKRFLSDHDAIVTRLKIIRITYPSESDKMEFRF